MEWAELFWYHVKFQGPDGIFKQCFNVLTSVVCYILIILTSALLLFVETNGKRAAQKHVLLVLQKRHCQSQMRLGKVGLRVQGKHEAQSYNRQPKRRRSYP